MDENKNRKSDIIIYTTDDGLAKIETTFDGDTVWLSIDQMAERGRGSGRGTQMRIHCVKNVLETESTLLWNRKKPPDEGRP